MTGRPDRAPFLGDIAEGPEGGAAWWVKSADGTRLRLGAWPARGDAGRGTVLLFPGRTEYVEKYGRVAADLTAEGYGVVAFDWRGQGLADRPQHRRDMGHVVSFDEYRADVAAFRAAISALDLPEPFWLIAHSMGGAIGLRALHDGLPVRAAVFSAPMWGIQMTPFLKSIASVALGLAAPLGLGDRFAPTTGPWVAMAFDDNPLTTDRDQFDYMSAQLDRHPELALGGPSVLWVKAALRETRALMAMPAPDVPALTVMGSREGIVEVPAIEARMADWPGGALRVVAGGLHELLMESPPRRAETLAAIRAHFAAHAPAEV
ncbi:MAG: alpha/beta fold hydrolase [Roseicyclus sp.]